MSDRIEGGLRSAAGEPIPLRAVDVTGEVMAGMARIRVRQQYENKETSPIEAIYTFPLPAEATLCGFTMESGGKRLEGAVFEREKAFEKYDDALVSGHGAALLDKERANVFTASVGNLLPGESTMIEVEYLERLHATDGALRVVVPTLVAPRYIPGGPQGERTAFGASHPTSRVPDADRISPRQGIVDYTVSLDIAFRLGHRISLSSPSHAVSTTTEEGAVRVRFAAGREKLDRDIVLLAEGVDAEAVTHVVAHRGSGQDGFFAMTHLVDLQRETAQPAKGLHVIFVLDRSGSMGGSSIEEARKALRLCLRQLREGDRFSIIAFDDRQEVFVGDAQTHVVPFTQRTLQQADAWIASIDARGGTELLEPMAAAASMTGDSVIVLLTDGQVGNENEILANVLAKRGKSRIYTFGIGTNVSDVLLRQLARRTGGASESIHPGERIDEKVIRTFSRAIAPRVSDVRISWDGVEVDDVAPTKLDDLVDGEPWTIFGRYATPGRGRVDVRGTFAGQPWHLGVPLDLPDQSESPSVPKLWAAERVQDLELVDLQGRRGQAMKDRIVAIAIEHQIASTYTSFLVVERRTGDRRTTEMAKARPIPVNGPHGWGSPMVHADANAHTTRAGFITRVRAPHGYGAPPPAPFAPPPPPAPAMRSQAVAKAASPRPPFGAASPAPPAAFPIMPDPMRPQDSAPEDPIFAILSHQLASGLFADGPEKDADVRLVASTTRALIALLEQNIDALHTVHGALVAKAVDALVRAIASLADADIPLERRALAAAWLAAATNRARTRVEGAMRAAKLDDLADRTKDPAKLRTELLSESAL